LDFNEVYEIAPISGTIWFWCFLIVMFFLLMNLLLVMVIDKVSDFRREIGHTPTILTEAYHGMRDLFWRLDWRKEQIRDGEFRASISDPYADLIDELMEKSKITEEWQEEATKSCLGFRLGKRRFEDASIDGGFGESNPGIEYTSSLEMRQLGCDAMTAEHLLEEAEEHFKQQQALKDQSTIQQVREFVKLLRRHKEALGQFCEAVEGGMDEDQEGLKGCLDRLEASVQGSLQGFDLLRHVGVDSLAPPLPGQTNSIKKMMVTTLGDTLGVNGNFLGMESPPGNPQLRDAASEYVGTGTSNQPPMIMDAGGTGSTSPQRQRPPALEG
jgi:hypothetical protein